MAELLAMASGSAIFYGCCWLATGGDWAWGTALFVYVIAHTMVDDR